MPKRCCVPGCTNQGRSKKDELDPAALFGGGDAAFPGKYVSFHCFPQLEELKIQWINAIRRQPGPDFKIHRGTAVCSDHFTDEDFQIPKYGKKKKRLNPLAVPSRFDWSKAFRRSGAKLKSFVPPDELLEMQPDGTLTEVQSPPIEITVTQDGQGTIVTTTGVPDNSNLCLNVRCSRKIDPEPDGSLPAFCCCCGSPTAPDTKWKSQPAKQIFCAYCASRIRKVEGQLAPFCHRCGRQTSEAAAPPPLVAAATMAQDGEFRFERDVNPLQPKAILAKLSGESQLVFKCSFCNYIGKSRQNVKCHFSRMHREKLTCLECGRKFSEHKKLNDHMNVHNQSKPYHCVKCGWRTNHATSLYKHRKEDCGRNKGRKAGHCEICNKTFMNLTEHMKRHLPERPHTCVHCEKGFLKRSKLIEHLRTHTGEKPFQCGDCDYTAHTAALVRAHIRKCHLTVAEWTVTEAVANLL